MLLCVHVPSFGLAIARRDSPEVSSGEGAVLSDKPDRGRVIEADTRAHELGARIGQTVLQARAAAGGVAVFVRDAARAHAIWNDMLDALDAVSPLVDDAGDGTAYLEMRGVAGEPPAWIAQVQQALHAFRLPVRVAVGPNKFVARARTYAPGGRIEHLPVDVLQIEPRIVERLRLLGVRTLEDLAKLPHGPFVRRFGKAASTWHENARGIDPTPLRPRAHELQIDAAVYGEGTAEQEEQVIFALRILADRICRDLERAGRAAAQVRTTFECENGDVRELDTGFAQPTAEPRTMIDVLRAKLENVTFDAPITGLRMQAMRLEEWGTAATLFGQNAADPQAIAVALARLQSATGSAACRARVRPAVRMEARFGFESFDPVAAVAVGARESRGATPVPQLRLLTVREIAVTMRGNSPVKVGARDVLDCAGPWRVDDGWFEAPVVRDEFDVLLDDGMLCRIYRQGEHWYLRGAYD